MSGSLTGGILNLNRLLILLSMVPLLSQETRGQAMTASSFRDRVTDRVTLIEGPQIYGMAVQKNPLQMVVRTAWLNVHAEDLVRAEILPALKISPAEPTPLAAALEEEIASLKSSTPDDRQRIGLLMEIQQRLIPEAGDLPEYLILSVPKGRIKRVDYQPDPRRELCRLAILTRIPDFEHTHWKSLAEQIRNDPSRLQPNAHEQNQNVEQQLQRVLAACDVRLNSATRLIRQGDQIFDESAPPDISTLITAMMGGNLQSLLSELLDERPLAAGRPGQGSSGNTPPEKAIQIAASKSHKTIVLAGFDFDPAGGSASVSRQLFRQMPDSTWKLITTATGKSTVAELQPGEANVIAADPQLKEISNVVSGLGIGSEQLQNAIQLGAVVQKANKLAEQTFEIEIQGVITMRQYKDSQKPPVVGLKEKAEP